MKMIFGRSHKFTNAAIRLFTLSPFGHTGILYKNLNEEWRVIESTGKTGVVEVAASDFVARYKTWEVGEHPVYVPEYLRNRPYAEALVLAEALAIDRARSQIGKDYDYGAIVSFGVLHARKWDDPTDWFCSELNALAAGTYNVKRLARITPDDNFKNCIIVDKKQFPFAI